MTVVVNISTFSSKNMCTNQLSNVCVSLWLDTGSHSMGVPCYSIHPGGGTDLERGYGDVRPWRPPFHASPAARKGPISSKRVSSQDPLLRKFGNFSLISLNFHPNFSSQAPKFGNFQLTSPQIWKFFAHKPPYSEANVSSQAPQFVYAILHTLIHTLCLSKYATLPITLTADARSLQNLSPWNSKSVWIMPTVLTCAVITLCEH